MTMQVRVGWMLIVGLALMGLASCDHYVCTSGATFGSSACTTTGGGGGLNGTGTVYAYLLAEVGSSDGMAADTLDLSANTFQEASAFTAPPLPSTLAQDGGTVVVNLPSQKYLYIPFNNGTVYGYTIDGNTGALTSVPNSPYAVNGGKSIASTPAGTYLFVTDSANGDISVFSISATDGSLTAVAGSPFASGIAVAQLATDGQGKYLYATAGTGGAQVAAFAINSSTGALSPVNGSPFAFNMSKVVGENTGQYLLGITGVDSNIYVFDINAQTGALSEAAGSPFTTVSVPINITVHPNGNFVYAFDGLLTAMEGYQLTASTGALTAIQGSPFTSIYLQSGEIDQSGLYLFGPGNGTEGTDFGPYGVDTTSGVISILTYTPGGFPGGGYAVSDLNDAP